MLEDLGRRAYDELIVLGDTVLKLGDSVGALRLLDGVPHRAVYGNMEWAVLAGGTPAWPSPWDHPWDPRESHAVAEIFYVREQLGLAPFARQPATLQLADVLVCHATPRSCFPDPQPPRNPLDPDDPWVQDDERFATKMGDVGSARVVLCGHIHVPYLRRLGAAVVVNPGAVGWSREQVVDPFKARYALLDVDPGRAPRVDLRAVAYDNARAVADLRRKQERVESRLTHEAREQSRLWHDRHARLIGG